MSFLLESKCHLDSEHFWFKQNVLVKDTSQKETKAVEDMPKGKKKKEKKTSSIKLSIRTLDLVLPNTPPPPTPLLPLCSGPALSKGKGGLHLWKLTERRARS